MKWGTLGVLTQYGQARTEHVHARHFEIRADTKNECTYGLLAFSDITHGGTLAPGYCGITRNGLKMSHRVAAG